MASKKKIQPVLSIPDAGVTTEGAPKKRVIRKVPVKKVTVKKSLAPVITKEIVMEEKTSVSVEIPKTVERVVFIHRCTHCQHVPFGVNILFTVCFVLLATLSTFLLYTLGGISSSFLAGSLQGEVPETVTLQTR
ncbi:TPA: hypothetical protein DEP34_02245 [Candidatus Uhrbacteria bacterium]|uniref:Uncharacterized protein n=2 Tax=Candidatus Uhriibacteriota TaxID=1752732 RepID=A0A0G1T463_9BACT|nr:MAG: hypothetical protein UX45_C0032G0012 [Candidatus Uhrbacteria bacterium GW2011_GWF2_46_218]KKU40215.1 MAG: hypothetical protein UX57_C0022G0014 [Candidatus Uhrbacteria bacterium GW2011_GWE2_46_68]HBK33937.1 hypothetical protein [Candidatus Uhrbacteria bacterium]HCB19183.1 hypothetical protein [Candidatus Uhrbacteria bacterium]